MMNYGKMVIVGNSIEELEQDLEMFKVTLKSGKMCAVGGSSVEEVEKGLAMMKQMMEMMQGAMQTNATMATNMAAGQTAQQQANLDAIQNVAGARLAQTETIKDEYLYVISNVSELKEKK